MSGTLAEAKRRAREMAAEDAAGLFFALLKRDGLPLPQREWLITPDRKWRADFAWPLAKLALEVEGGVWSGGRHTRGAGFLKDMQKYNHLTTLGWRLLRTTPDQLATLTTVALIRATLTPQES